MFGGKIRIRKVHNYGFALGMLSGEDRLVKGGSLGAGILLLIYYMKLLFSKRENGNLQGHPSCSPERSAICMTA